MLDIIVNGAREGNLKNISLTIPRNKLVVFTGLSGSGKSTLVMDVIYNECQRQYLEAMDFQGIHKPKVDFIHNASPAIIITQNQANKNPRSTVGTLTDIYTELRMVYEKLGVRECPNCKKIISSADCKEEIEKSNGEFTVFMYCNHCNHRMEKLIRTHFSYNTREGACKSCQGLGKILKINEKAVIDEKLSLEDGAVDFWEQRYKEYQISCLYSAFKYYKLEFKPNTLVKDFTDIQKSILYHGVENDDVKKAFPNISPPKTVLAGKFEGVFNILWRKISENNGDAKNLENYFNYETCMNCMGERLGKLSSSVVVENKRLPELSFLSLEELYNWICDLENSLKNRNLQLIEAYLIDLKTKIQRIINVGLGYLTLDRQSITLSGGELQRIKISATLDSNLTGIIYIMDEPTIGLHPKDTDGMISVLKRLKDLENTVIVIEHDTDIMKEADFIIDIGPGSGKHGGEIIATGILDEIINNKDSVTGSFLKKEKNFKKSFRRGNSHIEIKNAKLYNLKNVNVKIPIGCLTTVTGVSGSGKSTLIFEVLGNKISDNVYGIEEFDEIITIEQSAITRMKRSNIATYSEVYSEIRKIFGGLNESKEKGLSGKEFSFNTPGGRCENCQGLGYVSSNMLFFKDIDVVCPVCGGNQFNDDILSVKYKGHSIKDILLMSVEEALNVFGEKHKIEKILKLLQDVGLGYLELGQTLTTLSAGEGQRLKLAKELINNTGKHSLYLMDEPTTGLHPIDVENFLVLLNRIVDSGNTVIVVEHNQQVIINSDFIVDLGPGGGEKGGEVVFLGTPLEMIKNGNTFTAEYLSKYLGDTYV